MRRKEREVVDVAQIINIIKRCDVCRLGLNDTPVPYIVPMNFAIKAEGESIELFFHSAIVGHKIELIDKDPRCSFQMDCDHAIVSDVQSRYCTEQYSCVMGTGVIEKVSDDDAKYTALKMINDRYHPEIDFPVNLPSMPRTTVLRLKVQSLSAKSNVGKIHIPSVTKSE